MSHTPLLAELDPFAREIADAGGMSYEQALVYLQQVSTEMPYSLFEAVIAHKAEPKRVDLQSLLTEIFGEAADQFTTHTVTAEPSEYMNY